MRTWIREDHNEDVSLYVGATPITLFDTYVD